ncbi:thiamine phosphate synthase [Aliidiomarina soli]|uniref:Phosphomethylpyrimidine kinase n=1 Tax=Aliidiomarina soli TaxID=1928574 RepID=A0A432WFC7_9GAMM|nr:thiamine phosphate synthase [Aliidiomarina soli]RUO32480.1 phosphomethylpyrimidine kinase [Aliidiomarina soli]
MSQPPIAWTIAGSDSGGGAGIQADMAAMRAFGVHPCSVVSALTAQNSQTVTCIEAVSPAMFAAQLECLHADLPARAIKTGMLATAGQVSYLADYYTRCLGDVPLLVDPVAVSASGQPLAGEQVLDRIRSHLIPLAALVTPNIAELAILCGHAVDSDERLQQGAEQLLRLGAKAVLVKGGHAVWQGDQACDYFFSSQLSFKLIQPRQPTVHSHGTGCSMASAIAACLARGDLVEDAVVQANAYIAAGLSHAQPLGQGPGPVAHTQLPSPPHYFAKLVSLSPRASDVHSPAFEPVDTDNLGLYPIVDNTALLSELLRLGVQTIQLRIKEGSQLKIEAAVAEAVLLGRRYQARVFINDYWQFALKHKAYGVHLGQEDLQMADLQAIRRAGLRLGVSTHGYYELLNALALRPSYVALGHVFATPTKAMKSSPQGLQRLAHYTAIAEDMPTVAVGGINLDNAAKVKACGVGSIAVVRAVTDCINLAKQVEAFTDVIGR